MAHFTRRDVLKGLGAAGLLATGFKLSDTSAFFGINPASAQSSNDDLQTIINIAATAELFAATHYIEAVFNAEALNLDEFEYDYMNAGVITEYDHYQLLVSLGAEPLVTEFYFPDGLFENRTLFSGITEIAETAFVGAYLAATRIFAEAAEAALAVTTAQIAAVEAEHRAFARRLGLRLATNLTYAGYVFENVSDAVPVLQPFLEGGEGFGTAVRPPSDGEVEAVREEVVARGFDNTVSLGADPIESIPFAARQSESEDSEE